MKKLIFISCLAISTAQAMQKELSVLAAAQSPMLKQVRKLNSDIQQLLFDAENGKTTLGALWERRCSLIDEYEKVTNRRTPSVNTKVITKLCSQIENRFNRLNSQLLQLIKQSIESYKCDCISFEGIKNCCNLYAYLRTRIVLKDEVPEVLSSAILNEIESLRTTIEASPTKALHTLHTQLNSLKDNQDLSFEEFYALYDPLVNNYIFLNNKTDQANPQMQEICGLMVEANRLLLQKFDDRIDHMKNLAAERNFQACMVDHLNFSVFVYQMVLGRGYSEGKIIDTEVLPDGIKKHFTTKLNEVRAMLPHTAAHRILLSPKAKTKPTGITLRQKQGLEQLAQSIRNVPVSEIQYAYYSLAHLWNEICTFENAQNTGSQEFLAALFQLITDYSAKYLTALERIESCNLIPASKLHLLTPYNEFFETSLSVFSERISDPIRYKLSTLHTQLTNS